jgi:hypothetical protein
MARCIDDAHALRDVPAAQRAADIISVRTSAMQLATEMMSAMLAVIGQQNAAPDDLGTQNGWPERPPGLLDSGQHQASESSQKPPKNLQKKIWRYAWDHAAPLIYYETRPQKLL